MSQNPDVINIRYLDDLCKCVVCLRSNNRCRPHTTVDGESLYVGYQIATFHTVIVLKNRPCFDPNVVTEVVTEEAIVTE